MSYVWFDLNRTDLWEFTMVTPQSLDQTYGELTGVELNSVNITAGYYTDSRTSASMRFVDQGQYVPYSFIRITHRIPEWSYENEIGTYIVKSNPSSKRNGAWVTQLSLGSQLDKTALRKAVEPWTVSSGAKALTVLRQMMSQCNFEYREIDPNDYTVGSTFIYETGGTYLSRFYDLCLISNNRLDVDGHGRLTISKYLQPISRAAAYRIDLSDPHGIVLDGSVNFETDTLNTPNQCIVAYRFNVEEDGETYEAELRTNANTTGENSAGKIGYTISDFYEITDMDDVSYEQIQTIARNRLASLQQSLIEWDLTCKYLPIWEGDIVELNVTDGPYGFTGIRHCLVKSVVIHPDDMTIDLTLKETSSGDYE